MPTLIDDMGFHALLILMVLASIAGLAAGVVLIVHPGWLGKAGRYSNRWVSTRKLDRSLEKWISLDKWFYQYHRVSGSLMLAGAAWILVFFVTSFDKQRLLAELSRDIH